MNGNDFTYDEYSRILIALRDAGYIFPAFVKGKRQALFLRHDIDISLNKAVDMAELENAFGVSSTYFFMVQSPLYNLFSEKGVKTVNMIRAFGHRIGVHLLGEDHKDNVFAVNAFKNFFDVPFSFPVVSIHKPGKESYSRYVNGCVNVYGPDFFVDRWSYTSDSTGTWRFGHPLESDWFKNKRTAQLLIHPVWWGPEKTTLEERRNQAFLAAGNKYHRDLLSEFPLFGGQDG